MKRLCPLLVLALCLCAGAAFGNTHKLALGVTVDVPDAWKVSSAAKPGTNVRIAEAPANLFAATLTDSAYFAMFNIRVQASPPGIADALRNGPEAVKKYYVNRDNVLREYYGKLDIELKRASDAEVVQVDGYASIVSWHVIHSKTSGILNIFVVTTPVGEKMYEFSFAYVSGKDKESVDTFVSILASLRLEGGADGTQGYANMQNSAPPAPGDAQAVRPDAGKEAAKMRGTLDRLRHSARVVSN